MHACVDSTELSGVVQTTIARSQKLESPILWIVSHHSHQDRVTRIVSYRVVSSNHLTNPEVVVIDHLRHAQISGQTRRIRRRRQEKMGLWVYVRGRGRTLKTTCSYTPA